MSQEKREKRDSGADPRLGLVLRGKYRLDRVLGVGGMATVYAATHRNSKQFAVKVLHAELSSHESVRGRFLREGYLANQVKHPGAVVVLDDDVAEDGSAFVVMELLEGSSLEDLSIRARTTTERKLGLPLVLSIGDALLDVLIAAHERGIVHRDLKPANVFLTGDGALKILDFGIASLRDDAEGIATLPGAMIGTPAFMAPEQALAKVDEIDARTDLWAVGATLFSLLSDELVHEGENASQLLVNAATKPARSITTVAKDIPPAIAKVIDRALAFEKGSRWPTAMAMRDALVRATFEATGTGIAVLRKRPSQMPPGSGSSDVDVSSSRLGDMALASAVKPIGDRARRPSVHASARGTVAEPNAAPSVSPSAVGGERVTHVRGTLIAASVLSLRGLGHFDRYVQNLPAHFHDAVLQSVPGTWIPIEIGIAHYRAAEALGLTAAEQFEIGRRVAERVQKGVLGTLVRLAKSVGVTPWMGLDNAPKMWERVLQGGGGFTIVRLGPKEARVECRGIPELAELGYFRNGFGGMFEASGELFCSKVYVRVLEAFTAKKIVAFRIAWA